MRVLLCAVAVVAMVALAGCGAIAYKAPVWGAITVDEKGPMMVGDQGAGTDVGVSMAQGIIIVAYGDASIQTAMANGGGIKRIHHVDCETFNVLGIYACHKTVVYGSK